MENKRSGLMFWKLIKSFNYFSGALAFSSIFHLSLKRKENISVICMLIVFFLFLKHFILYLHIADWQYCDSFRWTAKQLSHRYIHQIRSDQSLSRVWLFATPWIAARQASLSITNSRSSLRLTSIESVHPFTPKLPSHPAYHITLNRVPCTIP